MSLKWERLLDDQWVARAGSVEVAVYMRLGRCWVATINDDSDSAWLLDLGEFPTRDAAQRAAEADAPRLLRSAAEAIERARDGRKGYCRECDGPIMLGREGNLCDKCGDRLDECAFHREPAPTPNPTEQR